MNTPIVITSNEWLHSVCLPGQNEKTCRFLAASSKGILCAKNNPTLRSVIDIAFMNGTMKAKGDNCEGYKGQ